MVDLKVFVDIVYKVGVLLLVDMIVIFFYVFYVIDFGVDIEIVFSMKYILGGVICIGGLIIDYGIFDWEYFVKLVVLSVDIGKEVFIVKFRKEVYCNFGVYMIL